MLTHSRRHQEESDGKYPHSIKKGGLTRKVKLKNSGEISKN